MVVEHSFVGAACEFLKNNKIEFKFERIYTNEVCEGIKFIFNGQFEKTFLETIYQSTTKTEEKYKRGI